MERMHLKRRRKHKNSLNIVILIIMIIIVFIVFLLDMFNKKALPQLISYSEIEVKKIISSVINSTVIEETYKNNNINDLFIIDYDNNYNVINIDFNSKYVNQILANTYKSVEKNLYYLETGQVEKLNLYNSNLNKYNDKLKKGIIYELPSGIIVNNTILNNILPKIPVKINLIGNTFCRLDTDIKPYGINNALLTVNVVVEVEIKILLPFVSSNFKAVESIPILMKIIEGSVPSYYFDGYLSSPTITNSN